MKSSRKIVSKLSVDSKIGLASLSLTIVGLFAGIINYSIIQPAIQQKRQDDFAYRETLLKFANTNDPNSILSIKERIPDGNQNDPVFEFYSTISNRASDK